MKGYIFALGYILVGYCGQAQNIRSIKITDLEKTIASTDSVLVVNFWATFCLPCIHEIPYFQKITDKYKSQKAKLLLVSLDMRSSYPAKVKAFVKKNRYKAEVQWLNETNADYFCTKIDPAWSGAIPASYFVNNKTGYRKLVEEEMTAEEFEKELRLAIGK